MAHGTKRQKNKKNQNRPKAGDVGYVSSMQRNYHKRVAKAELSPSEDLQNKLF
jgi:hypothetical protein